MTPTARRIPHAIALFGVVLLAAFTWVDRGSSRALQWPWYLYAQTLVLLPVLWLVAQGFIERRLVRFGGLLDWGLLGFAGAMIAAALASPERATSLAMLPMTLVPVTVAYATLNWLNAAPQSKRREQLALLGGAGLAFTSLLALLFWLWAIVLPRHATGLAWTTALSARNEELLGHAVYNAGLGVLTATWLGGLAREYTGGRRLGLVVGALIGVALIFATGSRSGFIGLGVWLVWLLVSETARRGWSAKRTAGLVLLCIVAAGTLFALQPRSRIIYRQWRESRTFNSGDLGRVAMAEFGGLVLRNHPALGIGPGATPLVYPRYRAQLVGGWETALQLHSTPVQWAADGGFSALAAALTVAVALTLRRRRAAPSFAAGALLAYFALGLTDYQLDLPLFAFASGVLIALLVRTPGTTTAQVGATTEPAPPLSCSASAVPSATVAALLAGLVAAYGFSQIQPTRARSAFAYGIDALTENDPASFETLLAEAHQLAPANTYYLNLHACILADIGAYPTWFYGVNAGPDHLDRALALFRRSLEADPDQELPHTQLAWHLLPQKPAEAAEHFRAAARLIPDKGSVYYGLALALLAQNRTEDAARALAMELLNNPEFVSSPEWIPLEQHLGLAARARKLAAAQLDQIVDQAAPSKPPAYVRRARYVAALLRWLGGNDSALAAATDHAEPAQREILGWLAGHPVVARKSGAPPWHVLAHAVANPGTPLPGFALTAHPSPTSTDETARALQTSDRRSLLLLASTAPKIPVSRAYRERLGYNLIMRNLDAPAPRDPYIVPSNRIVRAYLLPLFPEKGFLPGPILVRAAAELGLAPGTATP